MKDLVVSLRHATGPMMAEFRKLHLAGLCKRDPMFGKFDIQVLVLLLNLRKSQSKVRPAVLLLS